MSISNVTRAGLNLKKGHIVELFALFYYLFIAIISYSVFKTEKMRLKECVKTFFFCVLWAVTFPVFIIRVFKD